MGCGPCERFESRLSINPGWYVILYHDVSWEDSILSRTVGGCCPPDLFERQVNELRGLGQIVTVEQGIEALHSGIVREPLFSLWFDDGLRGVYRNAYPLLSYHGLTAAVSVCSAFTLRKELFWRHQLSFLAHIDGMRHLRSRLRRYGYQLPASVKQFTCENFSIKMRREIQNVFDAVTTPEFRQAAHKLFMNTEELEDLRNNGWTLANHTARHYRMVADFGSHELLADFQDCEMFLRGMGGSRFWVLPFGFPKKTAELCDDFFAEADRWLVFVGNRTNKSRQEENILYRIDAPISEQPLRCRLEELSRR